MRFYLLLFTAAVAVATVTAELTKEERNALIQEAITAAKTHATEKQNARKAQTQSISHGRVKVTSKHYKQITKEARRQGEARQLFENMVHRAERKLAEAERQYTAGVQSAEERAEALAAEVFHRPGTSLSTVELMQIIEESNCIGREEGEMPECYTPFNMRFRTINGTCNNVERPFLGAADTPLPRLIPAQYEDGVSSLRGDIQNLRGKIIASTPFQPPVPSARHVSQTVIRNVTEDESVTHILMQFGQFLDHDLSLSPELEGEPSCTELAKTCEFSDTCRPIRVAARDPILGIGTENNGACLPFSRSLSACPDPEEPLVNRGITAREQINVLTSFIDGSMIYGSNEELADKIRKHEGGLLLEGTAQPGKLVELPRLNEAENVGEGGEPLVGCPNPGNDGCFLAGEFRVNEQVVLSVMHTLWFREHNRIARELARINPRWDDERLYQEARRIVGALLQKITYLDYLPKIFGPLVYDIVLGEYLGYDDLVNPGINNAFATAAYRYGHTLIRPFFDRLISDYSNANKGPLSLLDAFYDPDQYRLSYGTGPLLRGLVTQNAREVDEFLTSALTNDLFREHLDLASLNIQRGRDHGLPPYITFQRYCNKIFPKLGLANFENTLTFVRFLEIYGSVDTIDLWIGGLAERSLPQSLLGPTFACLFGITFANIRDGDRLYYSKPGVFEPDQLASIQKDTFARIICDNGDGFDSIQRDVFLAAQKRVNCNQIPRIDLELWREEVCHFRINVNRESILTNNIQSFSAPSLVFQFFDTFERVNDQVNPDLCIPLLCPIKEQPVDVAFNLNLGKILQPNAALPLSILRLPFYNASWPASLFGGPGTGVYKSLSSCRASGAAAAFTVSSFASAQQISDSNADEVPEPFRDLLFNGGKKSSPVIAEAMSPVEAETSDAHLMSELEEALKSLNS